MQAPRQAIAQYFVPSAQSLFGTDRLAVLILGIDYNYDERDIEYSAGARSDTIMAVSRDMDVILPSGQEEKINAAYAEGASKRRTRSSRSFWASSGSIAICTSTSNRVCSTSAVSRPSATLVRAGLVQRPVPHHAPATGRARAHRPLGEGQAQHSRSPPGAHRGDSKGRPDEPDASRAVEPGQPSPESIWPR